MNPGCEPRMNADERGSVATRGASMSLRVRGMIFASLIFAMLVGINFDAKVRETQVRAFGPALFGAPTHIAMSLVSAVLASPLFATSYHLMVIMESWAQETGRLRGELSFLLYLLRVGRLH